MIETDDYSKTPKLIAIDPGANGGIAIYSVSSRKIIEVVKMPATPSDLLEYLARFKDNSVCYLERVQGLPGMGGAAMFSFGRGFGWIEMALICLKIKTVEVTPQKWQKALQLGVRGDKTATQWKNKLKVRAQQLFPEVRITLAVSDALLILEYARLCEKE